MTSQTISLSEWCVEEGKKEGRAEGIRIGARRGARRGRAQGLKQGIVGSVKALASVGVSRQVICQQLMSVYHLSEEDAEKYIADGLK